MSDPADVVREALQQCFRSSKVGNPKLGHEALAALDTLEAQLAEARTEKWVEASDEYTALVAENTRLRQELAETQTHNTALANLVEVRRERIAALERVVEAVRVYEHSPMELAPSIRTALAALDEGSE